jgi:site-specific DNA recombinase
MTNAVAYYRMSTDRQEDSIGRQQSQVEPYAARCGYTIIREYKDEGIAGDEPAKRKGFVRMLEAAQRKEFDVILCDDKDRFGRFDSVDYGEVVAPLRRAGVRLETVAQGRVDWKSLSGRILDALLQEFRAEESKTLSRRVITQMLAMAKAGKWLGGVAPYGYKLVQDDVLVKRLVPGNPEKVTAVRLMFRLYGDEGYTLDMLAKELYTRGIADPRGSTWNKTTIRAILRNRKYTGDMARNTGHDGKYSDCRNGSVQTSDVRIPKRNNPPEDWVVVPDVHEPLVGRALFERVQVKLAMNKMKTTPHPKGGQFVLSGLLICGHCGWRMIGCTWGKKRYYKCGRYHQEGKHACHSNTIMENKLLDCIVRKLQEAMLNPANLEKLKREIRRQAAEAQAVGPARASKLQKQLAALADKIGKGVERMALIDRDLLPEYTAKIRDWKSEHRRLAAELQRLEPPESANLDDAVKAAVGQLRRLQESLPTAPPHKVRAVLQELISKVELFFDHVPKAGKTRSIFKRGVIYVRQQQEIDLSDLCNAVSPTPAGSGATR